MKIIATAVLLLSSTLGVYAQGPFNVSVTPVNVVTAQNKTVAITAAWSSNDGAGGILYGIFYAAGCEIYYTPSKIALLDPDAGTWVPANKPVGFGSVQNRICGVTADKAHLDGDVLTVEFLITFFTGPGNYPIYLAAVDDQGHSSAFEQKDTLTLTPGAH